MLSDEQMTFVAAVHNPQVNIQHSYYLDMMAGLINDGGIWQLPGDIFDAAVSLVNSGGLEVHEDNSTRS